jgi:hypothetical protein
MGKARDRNMLGWDRIEYGTVPLRTSDPRLVWLELPCFR